MSRSSVLAAMASQGVTAAEFDYLDGVGSNVQTQLNAKLGSSNPTVTLGTNATFPAGHVVQVVNYQTGAMATGTTTMPHDNTIPQQSSPAEGTEFMTLAITPASATNKLLIQMIFSASHSVNDDFLAALFQDTTAGALSSTMISRVSGAESTHGSFNHFMTAGTTSATTFKLRIGSPSAGTMTFNGVGGAARLGGSIASSITISEIQV